MGWWLTLSVDPGNVDQNQLQDNAIMIGGILLATAIIIFGWRVVSGMSFKSVVIIVGLILFVAAFVIPELR